jgi:pimeloyl-ACP methyl ester carboxylesterase
MDERNAREGMLDVDGARLHYDVRGSGPWLLMIPGGPADAGVFHAIRDVLADRYTVVTYDPRGLSHSPLTGDPVDTPIPTFADDAHRLLTELGATPAYVFANSGGALVALDLVTRYPEDIRMLVAHEPPATNLLPDRAGHAAAGRAIYDAYRREGVGAAIAMFLSGTGLEGNAPEPPSDPSPEMLEGMAQMQRNLEFFFGHMMMPMGDFDIPVAELKSLPVVVAVGETSEGQLAHRAAVALAEQLGAPAVHMPGDHGGFAGVPAEFADRLHEVLTQTSEAGGTAVTR